MQTRHGSNKNHNSTTKFDIVDKASNTINNKLLPWRKEKFPPNVWNLENVEWCGHSTYLQKGSLPSITFDFTGMVEVKSKYYIT